MTETKATLRCQLIPIEGDKLILPNTSIAEVIIYAEPELVEGAPAWLLGRLSWRDRSIALVSFEGAAGQALPGSNPRAKIVVINALGGNAEINFFAVVTQGLPQLLMIDEGKIAAIANENETGQLILSRVVVNGEPAIIPDMDALEGMLLACKKTWMKHTKKAKPATLQTSA